MTVKLIQPCVANGMFRCPPTHVGALQPPAFDGDGDPAEKYIGGLGLTFATQRNQRKRS